MKTIVSVWFWIQTMEAKVLELVRAHTIPQGSSVAGTPFTILYGVKQRFQVAPQQLESFISQYCTLAADDEDTEGDIENAQGLGLNVGEVRTASTLPVIVVLMLRFDLPPEQRQNPELFGEEFLAETTVAIQEVMVNKLLITPEMSELICVVQESRVWQQGSHTCVRVQFQFPYAQVDFGYQSRDFRAALIRAFRNKKLLNELDTQPVGDWDAIIEDVKDVVPLYRSKGDGLHCPMSVTHYYGYDYPERPDGPARVRDLRLEEFFRPDNHSHVHRGVISRSFLQADVEITHWLPLLLSISFWSGVTNPKLEPVPAAGSSGTGLSYGDGDHDVMDKDPVKMFHRLSGLLSVDRYNIEPYWKDIGRVLYNITGGSEEGLKIFVAASAKATVPSRDKESCMVQYYLGRDSFLTIKTIGWYAREDSPQGYQEWHNAWAEGALNQALSLVHSDVVEALWRIFWLDYLCVGGGKGGWLKFNGTNLRHLDDATHIRNAIDDVFIPIYRNFRSQEIQAQLRNDGNASRSKEQESTIAQIGALIKKLGTQGYRTSVVTMSRDKFHINRDNPSIEFEKIRDSDPSKTAWLNCVIECCGNRAYPRPGKPEDYITMNTYIPYRSDMSWEHPLVKELMTWMSQCFTDKDLLRYFLKDAASFLQGRNSRKKLRVWTGPGGDNSKSMVVKLFQATLGGYCCDFPVDMLMKTFAKGSGPNPELAQARGSHLGIIAEPDQDEELQGGKIKKFTGGDRFFARMCNENGGGTEATFNLVLMCNNVPMVPGADKATMNRFLNIPFLSTWVEESKAPRTEEERMKQRTFIMDPFFEKRIPELAHAFGWVLTEFFHIYMVEGMPVPAIITECTEQHWEDNDPFINFIRERVVAVCTETGERDLSATFTATDLYPVFKTWFRENFPGADIPKAPRFRSEMLMPKRLGAQNSRRHWCGVRIQVPQNDGANGSK